MNQLLYKANQSELRLHPFVMCLLFLPFLVVGTVTMSIVFALVMGVVFGEQALVQPTPPHIAFLDQSFSFVCMLVLSVLWIKVVERRPALGIFFSKKAKQYLAGALGGSVAVTIPSLISIAVTGQNNFWQSAVVSPAVVGNVLLYLAFFLFQGAAEELLCRSVLMVTLGRKIGILPSVAVTSLIFSALHLANPGIKALPLFNLFLAGLVFGIMMYYHQSPWPAFAAHSLWNFMMGNILGISVSGGEFGGSIFHPVLQGPDYLSGGQFGVEGTIFTTILGVAIFAAYVVLYKKKFGTFSAKASLPLPVPQPQPMYYAPGAYPPVPGPYGQPMPMQYGQPPVQPDVQAGVQEQQAVTPQAENGHANEIQHKPEEDTKPE